MCCYLYDLKNWVVLLGLNNHVSLEYVSLEYVGIMTNLIVFMSV